VAYESFAVRKPPVVLVHGYHSDLYTWSPEFLTELKKERGNDFVIPINYGTANGNEINRVGDFKTLLTVLNNSLYGVMESREAAWSSQSYAWTRYDAVGHSQGGVLLRWLCSSSAAGGNSLKDAGFGFPPFRSESNHYRGRFNRVVTIGSPHAGSTLAHLAIRMDQERVPFRWIEPQTDEFKEGNGWLREKKDLLFQKKFMIDAPSPSSGRIETCRTLNAQLNGDSAAKIHFYGATIYGGQSPDTQPGENLRLPAVYFLLWLNNTETYNGKNWGQWIAPTGSDGVVDRRSQLALPSSQAQRNNASALWTAIKVCHATPEDVPPEVLFATNNSETRSSSVASDVAELLDSNGSDFGPSPSFFSLDNEMDDTVDAIEHIVSTLKARQKKSLGSLILRILPGNGPVAPDDTLDDGEVPMPEPQNEPPLDFTLNPEVDEPIVGEAVWTALVYGPDGISSEGLTLSVSGTYGEQASLLIDDAVVGRITLQVSYPSSTGKTVLGVEEVVETRDPGVLTGLELRPGSINLPAGGELPLEVWGIFSAGGPCRMFNSGMQFQSSNPAIATVSAQGVVNLIAPGAASVSVDDGASHTAIVPVTVLPAAPVITSPEVATVVVGQPLSYQIIANNSPTQYEADELPSGLVLNASTGLLSGTLNTPGTLLVRLGASNATGTGRLELRLLVDPGSSQAPQDIALDAAAVPANQSAGTAVGFFSASDPNPADVEFTFTLVAGAGADDNGLFSISGSQFLTSAVIDPVSKPLCRVRVRCTDQSGLFMEKAFELPVLGAPVIVSQPQGAQGMAGTDAGIILSVEAQGYGPLSYEWKLNGQTVGWAKEPVLELNPEPWSAGDWTVTVSNSYGSVTSQVAVVSVQKMGYSLWAYQNASWLGDESALMDDPGGLGVPNLLRFAFAGSAAGYVLDSGSLWEGLPRVVNEGGLPVLKFMRAADADLSAFRVMLSPDLESWSEYTPTPEDITSESMEDTPFWNSELIRMNLPVMPKVFFRIEAEE